MYIPLECFSSDKLRFCPRNMFHRKISEQPSLWFIKPSNQATQETLCEFMPQQRRMETPDLLSPGYSISPLKRCSCVLHCWHLSASGHAVHLNELWYKLAWSESVGLEPLCFSGLRVRKMWENRPRSCRFELPLCKSGSLFFLVWIKAAVWWECFVCI